MQIKLFYHQSLFLQHKLVPKAILLVFQVLSLYKKRFLRDWYNILVKNDFSHSCLNYVGGSMALCNIDDKFVKYISFIFSILILKFNSWSVITIGLAPCPWYSFCNTIASCAVSSRSSCWIITLQHFQSVHHHHLRHYLAEKKDHMYEHISQHFCLYLGRGIVKLLYYFPAFQFFFGWH